LSIIYTKALEDFDAELAELHIRGQWTHDPDRRQADAAIPGGAVASEPVPAGVPHIWKWDEIHPSLMESCDALPESRTARRALAFKNPELPRCTAQTMGMAIQVIRPRETAWAHRHTITALRFVIQGHPDLYTAVDGVACPMEDYDLVLTPGWSWHDHHNPTDGVAMWLDVLDVPLVTGLNQSFYEEYSGKSHPAANRPAAGGAGDETLRPAWEDEESKAKPATFRYPWREAEAKLREYAGRGEGSAADGVALEYVNTATGGSTLPTLSCWIQQLTPGFSGNAHRHTSSAVYYVVRGNGKTLAGDKEMTWSANDCFVVPNWTWHRHINLSAAEEAILFTVNDAPVLRALGLYREENAPA
jgi:1-hydroxy-2-naphthoate dioxygenase